VAEQEPGKERGDGAAVEPPPVASRLKAPAGPFRGDRRPAPRRQEPLRLPENDGAPHGDAPSGLTAGADLWTWLEDAAAEFEQLKAKNRRLAAQVRELERRLEGAASLSDDELIAQLPERMGRALADAHEVARELIDRSRTKEAIIRRKADAYAEDIRRSARADAQELIRRAQADAQTTLAAARAEAQSIVREAHTQRDRMLSDIDEHWLALEQQVQVLRESRAGLVEACAATQRMLEKARSALDAQNVREVAATQRPTPPVAKRTARQAQAHPTTTGGEAR
jgi:cell division septum initiation protein DivIVA